MAAETLRPMPTSQQTKRAKYLLRDAFLQSKELLDEDVLAASTIAGKAFVLIEEAARISPRRYTPAERTEVVVRFVTAMVNYSDPTAERPDLRGLRA